MTWKCSNCSNINDDDYEYCIACDLLKEDSDYATEEYNNHRIL